MVALVAPALESAAVAEREQHLDDSVLKYPRRREPSVIEDAQHRGVLRKDLGDESLNPSGRRVDREALEQPRRDPAAVQIIGDGERDFGARRIAQADVGRKRDRAKLPVRAGKFREQ